MLPLLRAHFLRSVFQFQSHSFTIAQTLKRLIFPTTKNKCILFLIDPRKKYWEIKSKDESCNARENNFPRIVGKWRVQRTRSEKGVEMERKKRRGITNPIEIQRKDR